MDGERVEPYDLYLGVPLRWDPNAPDAVLVSDDQRRAALAMRAHPDDEDQRCVVLRFDEAVQAQMTPPNDEGLVRHPLYHSGLSNLLWLGIVRESQHAKRLIEDEVPTGRPWPSHFIIPTKECVFEVFAANADCLRIGGLPRFAAPASFIGS